MSYSQYTSEYGTPTQQAGAAEAASTAATAAGNAQVNNPSVNPNLPNSTVPGSAAATAGAPPTTGPLSGPGYNENWYAQHGGDLSGPTNTQSLYDEGVNATNPYYANAMQVTNAGIDSAEAARGEGNSGAALQEIGTADANLSGQQALGQANLATSADTANANQYNASSNASNTAENSTNSRIGGGITAQTNLSTAQSNLVDNFYNMAQTGSLTADMASIEAQLQASGVDAATAQALTNDILTAGGIGAKAASGGK
jgi:hypothetical protein